MTSLKYIDNIKCDINHHTCISNIKCDIDRTNVSIYNRIIDANELVANINNVANIDVATNISNTIDADDNIYISSFTNEEAILKIESDTHVNISVIGVGAFIIS